MPDTQPIREDELQASVDGRLDAERHAAVEQYLADSPTEAGRIAVYPRQRDALRVAFGEDDAQPLPPELNLARLVEDRLRRRRAPWQIAAGLVLMLGIGAAGGWLLGRPGDAGRDAAAMALLENQAVATHTVYTADPRRPVELGAADKDHMSNWLSSRLRRHVVPPDLSGLGYALIGGRLLATEHGGAAALFVYEDASGTRLSVLMRPMAPDLRATRTETRRGSVNLCAWIAKGMGYAVTAALPDRDLDQASRTIAASADTPG
jgi:anti-sigma factor RsiW